MSSHLLDHLGDFLQVRHRIGERVSDGYLGWSDVWVVPGWDIGKLGGEKGVDIMNHHLSYVLGAAF
jgi:hypothetical protein